MKKENYKLYEFLKATSGNWRNAIFVECKNCHYGNKILCTGFLLTAGADGKPILFNPERFYEQTGEQIDKNECSALLNRCAFEDAYSLWLKWEIDTQPICALLHLTT